MLHNPTGPPPAALSHRRFQVYCLTFSPDGKTLVSGGGRDQLVKLWDVASGNVIRTLKRHRGAVFDVAFLWDEKILATAGGEGSLLLWDTTSWETVARIAAHSDGIQTLDASSDGVTLATGGVDGAIKLWSIDTLQTDALQLSAHKNRVNKVKFSSDGDMLVTAGNGTIKIWDARTGEQRDEIPRASPVFSISPDNRWLASTSTQDRRTIIFGDLESLTERGQLRGHTVPVNSTAFSPDAKLLATAGGDATQQTGEIKIWNIGSQKEQLSIKGPPNWIMDTEFSPNGRLLATASEAGPVRLWDVTTGEQQAEFQVGQGAYTLAFSPDGRALATPFGSFNQSNEIRLWNIATGKRRTAWEAHTGIILALDFSPGGSTLVSGGKDSALKLWNVATQRELAVLESGERQIRSAAFSPDGKRLAVGADNDGTVKVLIAADDQEQAVLPVERLVLSVAISHDGRAMAIATFDGVSLWKTSDWSLVTDLGGIDGAVSGLAFSPDGEVLAAAGDLRAESKGKLLLWNVKTREKTEFPLKYDSHCIAFSPDGDSVAVGGGHWGKENGWVTLWDRRTRARTRVFTDYTGFVGSLAFSLDGKVLACCVGQRNYPGEIRLSNVKSGQVVAAFANHRYEQSVGASICYSPDGETLVMGCWDHAIRIWDVATGELKDTWKGHTGAIYDITFSPDGQKLVTTGLDRTIRVTQWPTGELLDVLRGHSSTVWSVAFTPDGSTLVSGGGNEADPKQSGELKLWSFPRADTGSTKHGRDDLE